MAHQRKRTFEESMRAGLEAHARGDHAIAPEARTEAFWSAQDNIQVARALRDGSASHIYLGELDKALVGANESVSLLEAELGKGETSVRRELGASQDRLGRVQTLKNMIMEETMTHNLGPSRRAFVSAKETLGTRDQYYINMIGRSAVASALYDSRLGALKDSMKALSSAFFSAEKKKSFGIALASLGLSLTLGSTIDRKRHQTRRFTLAKKVMQ